MQEQCSVSNGHVAIAAAVSPGDNIRRAAEDIGAGAEVLPRGTRLRPQELGLAASVGFARLPVFRRLRVALLTTGDELVAPGTALRPGQCFNSNRYTIAALLQALHCEVIDCGIVADDRAATRALLTQAAIHADLILSTGGVSVGDEDHVKAALEQLGHLDLWRVAVKPGKPLAFGRVGATPFIGLPGNPVSAFATFVLFVRPFVLRSQGATMVEPVSFHVTAAFDWPSGARREFLRARLERVDGSDRAVIHPQQGSAVLTSVGWGQGFVDVPAGQAITRGESVRFIPFSELIH